MRCQCLDYGPMTTGGGVHVGPPMMTGGPDGGQVAARYRGVASAAAWVSELDAAWRSGEVGFGSGFGVGRGVGLGVATGFAGGVRVGSGVGASPARPRRLACRSRAPGLAAESLWAGP